MPVERIPGFKQALSILQRLERKDEGDPRNQHWAQSSSSSWWSFQGSWWTHSSESHHGDEPSTDRTRWPVIQVFEKQVFRAWFSWIHLLCYRWIVYSWRRSTVTDGSVNSTLGMPWEYSENMWKMATRNEWDELQYHSKLERRVQQQAGQKAQQCEHQWRRWHTALRRSRGSSQHALSLHA